MEELTFRFVPRVVNEVDELAEHLSQDDAIDAVSVASEDASRLGAEMALVIIVIGSAGLAALTRLVDWLRDRRDCLLVIDARREALLVEERCDVTGRRGQVVIVTDGQQQVVIERSDVGLDLQAIVDQAMRQSAEAAVSLAKSLGAPAHLERSQGDI